VMRSVYKRIENLGRTGIFKSRKPAFDRSKPVWRFDVFNLTNEARGFLVEVYLDRIFTSAKIAGLQKEPTTYIVIDEAHLFLSEEHDHIINRLVREARKFGVALLLSSQSHSHFPEDIATGCGTRVILGIDEQYRERLGRLFGLKPSRFQAIKPRKSALIQMKLHNAELSNGFEDVLLGSQ
jgi:DNA helicase HerA-like ATPase